MSLESPLKKDIIKATKDLETVQRLFSVYFQGGIDAPPLSERKQLEALIAKIRSVLNQSSNASDKFLGNSLLTRHQGFAIKWDKTLNSILNGTIPAPKKRE